MENKIEMVEEVLPIEPEPAPTAVPLLAPADGVPTIIDNDSLFEKALAELAQGTVHLL